MGKITKGSCLCGAITYEINGDLRPIVACHCTQCRKTSGHFAAATQTEQKNIAIKGDTLRWFRSSDAAERGFCSRCGSNLFWRRINATHISIWAGSIDGPTELRVQGQLHTESAGDYYDLPDIPIIDQSSLR